MTQPTKHYPFHCGTQYLDWEEANCGSCHKGVFGAYPTCTIQLGLMESCFGDGSVSDELADRMGYLDSKSPDGIAYSWRCKEFEDASKQVTHKLAKGQLVLIEEEPGGETLSIPQDRE